MVPGFDYFVRLSSRSPKDAAYFDQTLFHQLKKEYSTDDDKESNTILRAIFKTLSQGMRVQTGPQAMELHFCEHSLITS
jgi:hypothetical protein